MSPHEPSHITTEIPLQALVAELRSRCEAVARLQGGSTYYHEEFGIFRTFAEEAGFIIQGTPDELTRPPDDEGNEHQVWFQETSQSYLKATWPDFFGLLVIYRPHEEHKAYPSPIWNAGIFTMKFSAIKSASLAHSKPTWASAY